MIEIGRQTPRVFKSARLSAHKAFAESSERWLRLCENYVPHKLDDTFWRYSRETKTGEPSQGWKLHISATILQACDLFKKVAPLLISENVRFKAPESLKELININAGLQYGYWQVGKFITIYPSTETEALRLARELHELTQEFISIPVPFDERYLPRSSVFYRYGAFEKIEMVDENGVKLPAIKNLLDEFVYDDRFQPVPEWLENPFFKNTESKPEEAKTPLMTTYKIFRAVTQRGKGGTYQGLDISVNPPRFCIVKEGRRHGEVFWSGQDGYDLVENEFCVLTILGKIYKRVPQVYSSFEADENYYFAMEYVEGKSLYDLMKFRQRRFSIKQVLSYAQEIARILEEIHNAGWVWNDCKPANLIVTRDKSVRPIDFENSYPANQSAPFDWKSREFSKPWVSQSSSKTDDFYALGAVVYFLLTGKFYDHEAPVPIKNLRRNVPKELEELVERLLRNSDLEKEIKDSAIRNTFLSILNSI